MVIRISDPDRKIFDALPDPAYSDAATIRLGTERCRVEAIETDGVTTTIRARKER